MSMDYCFKHDRRFDTDTCEGCPQCQHEEFEAERELAEKVKAAGEVA